MSVGEIYYTRCEEQREADWCAYACIDATNGNTWYWDSERELACNNDDWEAGANQAIDWDQFNSAFVEIRDGCMDDLDAAQCANICAAPAEYEFISEDSRRLACAWQEAD